MYSVLLFYYRKRAACGVASSLNREHIHAGSEIDCTYRKRKAAGRVTSGAAPTSSPPPVVTVT